jgi:hypothetical protein
MATIIIDFDHIEKGIKDLEKYTRGMEQAVDDAMRELQGKMSNHMSELASGYGLDESKLVKTQYFDAYNDVLEVGYDSEYAGYVEYGTGIVGASNPHPNPSEWEDFMGYDVNGHGDEGWKYIDANGKLRWTAGQPSRPIVYKTGKWANTQITRIFRKHIRRIEI